jgi:hypothetical protein
MKTVIIMVLLLATSIVLANEAISGKYRCKGYDFISKTYYDEKGIIKKTGDTFSFTRYDKKDGIYYATGVAGNSGVSFVFWSDHNKQYTGVATYEILKSGDLKGRWTVKNSKQAGEDFCEKISAQNGTS